MTEENRNQDRTLAHAPTHLGTDEDDFTFREVVSADRFAAVHVYYQGRYVGELKLWLKPDGHWYGSHLNYATFSVLGGMCPSVE